MENSLALKLKEETKAPHQELEKMVVACLKTIRSDADYVLLLRNFYAFFSAVEAVASPIVLESGIIDISSRRDSSYIAKDISSLGGSIQHLPLVEVPRVTNLAQAMGAMYVMEGSVLGGPYIVQMLAKLGVTGGVSFFSGYGDHTPIIWGRFIAALNSISDPVSQEEAVLTARKTFSNFGKIFSADIG